MSAFLCGGLGVRNGRFSVRDRRQTCSRRRFAPSRLMSMAAAENVKVSTALLSVYALADAEGYPILQSIVSTEPTVGALYFLRCEQAIECLGMLKKSQKELAEGSQVAVVPFHIAYEKVLQEPVVTENLTEDGKAIEVLFRFIPSQVDLEEAAKWLERKEIDINSMPEIPVFYFDSRPNEEVDPKVGRVLFIDHADAVTARDEAVKMNYTADDTEILLTDLMNVLREDVKVNVIPSVKNQEYVDALMKKAGMN